MPIPIWLVGRNTSVCTLVTQTVDASGNLTTPQVNYPLIGFVDEIEFSATQTAENIVNMTSTRENMVATELDGTLTLTEILQAASGPPAGVNGNILAEAWSSGLDYAVVTITRGGNTWTFTGLMQAYNESGTKGKYVGRMTLQPVNLGNGVNANPIYS